MIEALTSPVGLIAGNGVLPLRFAERARDRGLSVIALAHVGETDQEIENLSKNCTWVKVGQLGKIINVLKSSGVKQVAFAGGISRLKLFGAARLDWGGIKAVARAGSIRDDKLLRSIAREIEEKGIKVISPGILLTEFIPQEGLLTNRDLSDDERKDARLGWEAAKSLGSLDVGQTAVVRGGLVIALEAIEGTDATIHRAGELSKNSKGQSSYFRSGSVVVKLCKPQQDTRLDLPTIGESTIAAMQQAGATALVLEAEKTLILNPQAVVDAANRVGIAIRCLRTIDQLQ